MEELLYTYDGKLYINLTNKCSCRCTFCIRSQMDGLGSAQSLWLEHEPSADEVIAAFAHYHPADFDEIIFCGYGEPFCALDRLLAVSRYLRGVSRAKIRINTNGLGDLICKKPTAPLLEGLIDIVSISLNTSDPQYYLRLCRPSFGETAYGAMLQFARDCKQYVPEVKFSVVDVIPAADIAGCEKIAREIGIPLRVRHFTE